MFNNLIEVSSTSTKIHDFFEFSNDIHKMIGCKRENCDILNFLKPLEDVLFSCKKSYDYQRTFFISQCIKYPKVFNCMFQLRSKKANVKIVIKNLKIVKDIQNLLGQVTENYSN